jgi:UDPglucose--hexose-1-phosphate uridylyltransferase
LPGAEARARRILDAMRLLSEPHRRHDPLADRWILVSAGRTDRPWQGRVEPPTADTAQPYDPSCYLCPGNVRANGGTNPTYDSTFVFTNDFAALRPGTPDERVLEGLLIAEREPGTCRVVCYHPRHDLTMAKLPVDAVREIVDLWADQTTDLGREYRWVQVFENRGEAMGASNPHPHGQIWAGSALPNEAARESATQQAHRSRTGRRLLLDYTAQERRGERVVIENAEWLIVVPFWAAWPFETLIVPTTPVGRLADLEEGARTTLSSALVELFTRYDNLFGIPFPYSWGWHQAPFDGEDHAGWQLHAHVYPPLLRSATVRKFMVGYELLAEPQRDLTPEDAAERLRGVSANHYTTARDR